MVDYKRQTGEGGYLIIRQNPSNVQFLLVAAYADTFINSGNWSGYVNGNNVFGTYSYPTGRPTILIATYPLPHSQDVRFSIAGTGTRGLGGPTDFWQYLSIPSAPPAPKPLDISEITFTSLKYRFQSNGTGGAPFLRWEAAIADNPEFSNATIVTSGGTTIFKDLIPGKDYWVRSRGVNTYGTGAWSSPLSNKTLAGMKIKYGGTIRSAVPYVKIGGVVRPAIPYIKNGGIMKPSAG